MAELFEKIGKGVEFSEASNTPIPVGKLFNIAYLLILRIGRMEKAFEQWEEMQVGLKLGRFSRTVYHKPTDAIISARRQQRRPMSMGSQKIIHRKQMPKSIRCMSCKHFNVNKWKTRTQWRT